MRSIASAWVAAAGRSASQSPKRVTGSAARTELVMAPMYCQTQRCLRCSWSAVDNQGRSETNPQEKRRRLRTTGQVSLGRDGRGIKIPVPSKRRDPEFFTLLHRMQHQLVLDASFFDVFRVATWLLIATGAAVADYVFDTLTDGFVNVLPVLDRVGQARFDDGFKCSRNGFDQTVALFLGEDFVDQDVGLTEVVVVYTQCVGLTDQFTVVLPSHVNSAFFIGPGVTERVRVIDRAVAGVVVPHGAFEVVGVDFDLRTVDRQLLEVGTDTVALRILVGEVTAQQHLVRRHTDTRNHVGRGECSLLDFGEEIGRAHV